MTSMEGEGRVGAKLGLEPVGWGWRGFFWLATAYNLVIGALTMLSPMATVDGRIVGLLVACFGVIYLLVALDPRRYAQTLWAGVIGKIGVVGLLGPAAIGEGGDRMVAAILAGDALFTLGFLIFLFTRDDS